MEKYIVYEMLKNEIANTSKTSQEYEKRISELIRKLKI